MSGLLLAAPRACGILVPQPGMKLGSPALGGRFLTTGPPEKSLFSSYIDYTGFPVSSAVKNPPAMEETLVRFLGRKVPLEKG